MERNLRSGINFGIISGLITTLGLIIGLSQAGATRTVVMSAVLIIAFADAFSDALGIHLSGTDGTKRLDLALWRSIILTFFAKLVVASTFLIPILIASTFVAMYISILWAVILLTVLSYYLARYDKTNVAKAIIKNLIIVIFVVAIALYIGKMVRGINLP